MAVGIRPATEGGDYQPAVARAVEREDSPPAAVAQAAEPAAGYSTSPATPELAPRPSADEEPVDLQAIWRAVVADLKAQKKEMLASGLSHGRVLGLRDGKVRLGFTPQDGMFRRQTERSLKEAEAALSRVRGRPSGLVVEAVDALAEAAPSIAEEQLERTRVREASIERESREHPQVLAAMRLLGGIIESVRYLEEDREEDFASAADDGEDAGADET